MSLLPVYVFIEEEKAFKALIDASEPVISPMSIPFSVNEPVMTALCINICYLLFDINIFNYTIENEGTYPSDTTVTYAVVLLEVPVPLLEVFTLNTIHPVLQITTELIVLDPPPAPFEDIFNP